MNRLARLILGASGAVSAFVTLLPAAIAGLIALFDVSAHGLLGMSGTLLGLASPFSGGGHGLAPYSGVRIDLPRAALISLAGGLPPIGMIVLAAAHRTRWLAATLCGAAGIVTAGWPALPGCFVAAVMVGKVGAPPQTPPRGSLPLDPRI